jgi:integrase
MRDGPAPEPDLDVILPLLDPATFAPMRNWQPPRPLWGAERDVALVALCWIVGLRPMQIARVRRREWRPERRDILRVYGAGHYARFRGRDLPVLAPARDAVEAYLAACPLPLPVNGPLILRDDGAAFTRRDITHINRSIERRTNGRIGGLGVLAARYRLYVEVTRAEDGSVEKLVGRNGRFHHLDPGPKRLRRALEAVHPIGGGRPIILD